jgi:3-oxoacyl-[acyl-carrier-protein] synthase II
MKAPKNRRVYVIGYGAATALGNTFAHTWQRVVNGEVGFRKVSRCDVESASNVVGEIPDWNPEGYDFSSKKEAHNWNAAFVILTVAVCKEAIADAGFEINSETGPRTACLIGSAINGSDAFRIASDNLRERGYLRLSPYLLPNLCGNVPSGKAGMLLGFTGPIFSPQGACASGNHAIGIGARMIRDGDCDFALAGGADMPLVPEIIHGFANMNATIKISPKDRAYNDPGQASRPFSIDSKGFVLSEGAAVLVLASDEAIAAHGFKPKAEVLGVGWTSDANHFTRPNNTTVIRAINDAIDDAGLTSADINYVNAHGTSTRTGDGAEIDCLRTVFGSGLGKIPISSNKSQLGHSLGATAAIEAALTIEAMQQGFLLPTANYLHDPQYDGLDFVPNAARKQNHEIALTNAFGFGGTNCCIVFRGI